MRLVLPFVFVSTFVSAALAQSGAPLPPLVACGTSLAGGAQAGAEILCGAKSPEDLELTPDGKELTRVSGLNRPGALCVETKTGDIYFIDASNHVLALRAKHTPPSSPTPK